MTADRLAMLQRRAAADPGDVQAQAAWLRARVQAGERGPVACENWMRPVRCDQERWFQDGGERLLRSRCKACNGTGLAPFRRSVELAAYCGDAGARVAVGYPMFDTDGSVLERGELGRDPVTATPPIFADWLRGLARWGDEVMVRAAVAAAEVAHARLCICGQGPPWSVEECETLSVIASASQWVADKTRTNLGAWEAAWNRLPSGGIGSAAWAPQPGTAQETLRRDALYAAMVAGEQPVREAIKRALIEWALA